MTPETRHADSLALPAPSVADLERWFEEDVAEFKRKHKRSNLQPVPCEIAIGVWTGPGKTADVTADALSNAVPTSTSEDVPSPADVSTISPRAADRPDIETPIVSLPSLSSYGSSASTPRMIETIFIPSTHQFALAVYDPKTKTVEYANRVLAHKSPDRTKQGDEYYVPVKDNYLAGDGHLFLPSEAAAYSSQRELVAEIKRFIHRYADLSSEFWEDLIAHYLLMTYVFDRFDAIPYLRFLGEAGTGKTRILRVTAALAYKAISLGGASSVATLFRVNDAWRGTMVIDEADYADSGETAEVTKILNVGYSREGTVWRAEAQGKKYVPRPYRVFGPTILTTRKLFDDYAIETRCLTYSTVEKRPRADVPRQLPLEFYEEARKLRNKLLRWRFDNWSRISVDETKLRDVDARLGQIGLSIYAVATDEGFRTNLVKYFDRQGKKDKSLRPQAQVIEAIRRLMKKDAADVATNPDRRLCVKDVTAVANIVGEEWDQGKDSLSAHRTGRLVRSLGFVPEHTMNCNKFVVDPEILEELIERYGLQEKKKAG